MPKIGVTGPNKRKKSKEGVISEAEQRELSKTDAFKLFGSALLSDLSDEASEKIFN